MVMTGRGMQAGAAAHTHQQRPGYKWCKAKKRLPSFGNSTGLVLEALGRLFLEVAFYQSVQNLSAISFVVSLICSVRFPQLPGVSGCCLLHDATAWCWFDRAVQQGKLFRTVLSAKGGGEGDVTPNNILEGK